MLLVSNWTVYWVPFASFSFIYLICWNACECIVHVFSLFLFFFHIPFQMCSFSRILFINLRDKTWAPLHCIRFKSMMEVYSSKWVWLNRLPLIKIQLTQPRSTTRTFDSINGLCLNMIDENCCIILTFFWCELRKFNDIQNMTQNSCNVWIFD